MRHTWLFALALVGCHHFGSSHVQGGVLGRVVIYRNGVAFYERSATVSDGKLTVRVPRERVDDFLKSLTVVDRATRKPLSVTIPRKEAEDGSYLTMALETPERRNADVMLTYVTEAPAWKPSYRVVVGTGGKVMLESWAIVDNTSGEDWKGVLIGVGASSALAFRYDLWSVHQVDRDLLQGEQRFAIAPPTGVSPYSENAPTEELADLDATELRADAKGVSITGTSTNENAYIVEGINTTDIGKGGAAAAPAPPTAGAGTVQGIVVDKKSGEKLAGVTVVATSPALNGTQTAITDETGTYRIDGLPQGTYQVVFYYSDVTENQNNVKVTSGKVAEVDRKLKSDSAGRGEVIEVTGSAPIIDQGSTSTGMTITNEYTNNIPTGRSFGGSMSSSKPPKPPSLIQQGDEKLKTIADKVVHGKRDVLLEIHGPAGTDHDAAARASAVTNKLVDYGVSATRIHVVTKLDGGAPSVRVLGVAPGAQPPPSAPPSARAGAGGDAPVGESHFMAERPMTVRNGTSAMVAMVHGETTGGVVYLYDPISDRGDAKFAFKAVRLDNPTDDTLEPGPVTVYGDGRFIGEGITEPVPPHAAVVVPFALDRQIIVEREGDETDRIAKLVTAQRGVITAEVQHRRTTKLTITSRLAAPTPVYLRHRLEPGWTIVEAPTDHTKVGDSKLYRITVAPGETRHVTIIESTPVERTLDLSSDSALGMMQLYIEEPEAGPQLKAQIGAMLATHRDAVDLIDKITTLRDQLAEYRSRSGELHAQIVTLKVVKTGGDLMSSLKTKLAEMSDRVQKTTIAIVDAQEKLMLTRVRFQNQLAELKLTDATKSVGSR
jgi:carboxypeptidase family protein